MKLAILLWIYKDIPICINRAQLLRKANPASPLYVLYGGDLREAAAFESALAPYVDDFYAFPEPRSPDWKWLNGDLVVAAWFRDRGVTLAWDSVFIAQWDLLLLQPLARLCANLKRDELLLPGLRPIREVAQTWWWLTDVAQGWLYQDFQQFMTRNGLFPEEPLCCQFVLAALPRRFLERYMHIAAPQLGFLEYKLPIYAQAWGFGFCVDHPFRVVWAHERSREGAKAFPSTLNADGRTIDRRVVMLNSLSPRGARAFHPVAGLYPARLVAAPRRSWRPRRRLPVQAPQG